MKDIFGIIFYSSLGVLLALFLLSLPLIPIAAFAWVLCLFMDTSYATLLTLVTIIPYTLIFIRFVKNF